MLYTHKGIVGKSIQILTRFSKPLVIVILLLAFGCQKEEDTSAPLSIVSTNIADGTTEVDVFSEITVLFSEEMDASTVNDNSFAVKKGQYPIYGKVSCTGKTAVFKPSQKLNDNTAYNCTLSTEAKAKNGASMGQDYHWSFTSGFEPDVVAPKISKSIPVDMEISVFRNTAIEVYFDEEIDPETLNSNSFIVKTGETIVGGSITYEAKIVKFVPNAEWLPEAVYTCTLTRDVKDLAGNQLQNDFKWQFTTIPEVLSFSGLIQPIFKNQDCWTCHNENRAPDLRESMAYNSLVNGSYVSTDSPEDSRIIKQLNGEHAGFITQKEEDLILEWIKRGAQNN
ncbi:Ig-like domain-containing protein [Ancylomarina subtilis]|uniref:Ig-like domain-containing protein n=1 Tax=Ancylomarina subtilis TaxID=1639035 RepID=A0A4Q7V4G0_9BACT|nr:Ig-like domain-containing protein [Ancylomarina subtilis]RZT91351.1 Ig-like domain-containing protein [Ancylomarina subtilis]